MENKTSVGNQNNQQIDQNSMSKPSVIAQRPKVNYWMALIIILISVGVGGFYIYQNVSLRPNLTRDNRQVSTIPTMTAKVNSKQYINSFYHFKLDIPLDWVIDESVKTDGRHAFRLASPNKEIMIESPLPESTPENHQDVYYVATDLRAPEVQMGEYKVARSRYLNKLNNVMDYVSLSVPNQKLINLSFTINGDFETNNKQLLQILRTFSFTQKEQSLEEFVGYTIPSGWKKEELNFTDSSPDKAISLVSPDLTENPIPAIINGARIRISRDLHNPSRTLRDELIASFPVPLQVPEKTGDIASVKIGGVEGLNKFICWEGCYDSYYLLNGDYVWHINFSCAPNCSTKAEMEASRYRVDRDTFLGSFKFK